MKRGFILLALLLSINFVVAANSACSLDVSLVNQDPYPAIPGEYVKLVFQVTGISDVDCGRVNFELVESYPLMFDPNTTKKVEINSGVYARNFQSFLLVPYKVRIDKDALDGENEIEVKFSNSGTSNAFRSKTFEVYVEDARADFEVYVKDFNFLTNKINLEILNIAESDVEAVTLEIIDSEGINVKGAKTRIVGDLDSNEYTTAEFEVKPEETQIGLRIHYTDSTGVRRTTTESVMFYPVDFKDRKADEKESSSVTWIIVVLVIALVFYFWYRKKKKRRK